MQGELPSVSECTMRHVSLKCYKCLQKKAVKRGDKKQAVEYQARIDELNVNRINAALSSLHSQQ